MTQLSLILLVDDDEASNFLHQDLLESLQVARQVLTCESAQQAWALLETHQPDLLLLDINMPRAGMPVMSGLEFLEQLYPVTNRTGPVVLLTSSGHPRDIAQAADLGVACYLLKPLTEATLRQLLGDLFGKEESTELETSPG